ncbi:MAG: DUF4870 domain-containing protein [Novosphingobium sp.]|uniref:DUF4870 family protein n=1 Tax=Novosphingobium sp. TaxID=1874826 RepID=UPI0032BE3299
MSNELPPAQQSGFDLNHPTIISLLYLSSFLLGITAIIGVVLAFVWRGETHEAWEDSHYQYLINTFWIGLIGSIVGFILLFVLIGVFVLLGVMALMIVRCVLSLVRAQKREPMPNPATWLA